MLFPALKKIQTVKTTPCQIATTWLKNHLTEFLISPTGAGFPSILMTWLWVTASSNSQLKMSDKHWDREAALVSGLKLYLGQPNEW